MTPTMWGKFSEYGLIGLIVGILFYILWRMLVWVMAFVKDITEQHTKERETWHGSLSKQNDILLKISNSIEDHDKRADERGKYVREEHKEMIASLARINGFKHG